ncbi:anthranilate synthase component I [Deltaproteobacteria bacterium TL4]
MSTTTYTTHTFLTQGGVKVSSLLTSLDINNALEPIYSAINTHKGALFVSNFEYPDRYSRWDIGFVYPALELVSRKRTFWINALNSNGKLILKLIASCLKGHPHLEAFEVNEEVVTGTVLPMPDFFPEEERSKQPSIFSVIREIYSLFQSKDTTLGFYGAFGYDLVFQFENITPKYTRDSDNVDCHVYLPIEFVIVDRQKEIAYQLSYQIETAEGLTSAENNIGKTFPTIQGMVDGKMICDHQPGEFEQKVAQIREGCHRGDFFEVVLSQSFSTGFQEAPCDLFQRICKSNPSPYSFLINLGEEQLIGASPEMYVRVENRQFETSPISGTVAVGSNPMDTADRIKQLISSEKDESELTMCTDVDRNDMSRICMPGSVQLIGRRLLEQYSRLIHTVDHLRGVLAPEYDAIDALLCHMWACTVTGSPKPIAMQTIENLENSPRGWYSGCIGLLKFNGDMNTGMTLRTVHLKHGVATVRAGATLLYESDPIAEEQETRIKASAFMGAVLNKTSEKFKVAPLVRTGEGKTILFVDNHDSFVHTLGNYVRQTGAKVITLRSGFPAHLIEKIAPDLIFISPGPKTPKELKVPELVGEAVKRNIPIFGVCLGHQGIAEYFGGSLKTFEKPYHGKPSAVFHNKSGVFLGLPNPFVAGRYHSLYVDKETLPSCLEVIAETEDGIIMGLKHKTLPIASVQFHPESILTLKDDVGIRFIHKVIEVLLENRKL